MMILRKSPIWVMIVLAGLWLGTGNGCMSETSEDKSLPQEKLQAAREAMVTQQIEARGVKQPEVLSALRRVPRHLYLPDEHAGYAYQDSALPIGHNQTMSQPYIVGLMTELLQPQAGDKILEVGTGSGYQAAVLAELGATVYTIEIVEPLAQEAEQTLKTQGFEEKVFVKAGDGFLGWPDAAPFDSVIVTCAVSEIPPPLLQQLKPGGRLVLPLGDTLDYQTLTVVTKSTTGELTFRNVLGVVFVPMTGPHGFK